MPVGDVLHRGLLYTLVGITGWGIYEMGVVHMDILKRGRGAVAQREVAQSEEREQAAKEIALAEAAQLAASRKSS
ncbi:hypothetical protein PHLGIDRAFT_23163 [Phlebiopsis gigantea 11061_1 CR5-6]|uniref:Uncharacterized protein n=1 Tax=Phlebiopsis gigantea (strain 11061_1 CR5-6) TaxID=745531 RepID=A0A0C3NUJ2_PHLG1|nr:hypothetical protein PHLGIDRAFT_23163 [Phlebiopsis gigantea 11061_1 CR5-6]